MAKKLDINTKEKILKTAEQLIAKSGTNSFSLRDVAHKTNISLGTLYYHYKSKDQLIMSLAEAYLDTLNIEYFDWLQRHKKDLTSSRFLDVIFYKGVKLFNRGKIHLFLLNECVGGNKALQNKLIKLYKNWKDNLKVGIKQVFPKVKNNESFATLLIYIVDGMLIQDLLDQNDLNKEKKIKELLKGFAK